MSPVLIGRAFLFSKAEQLRAPPYGGVNSARELLNARFLWAINRFLQWSKCGRVSQAHSVFLMKNKVRKAVIPVAGYGTRFLPATKAQPKEMLPVIDKPAVQYCVEEAVAAGIEDIILITGSSKRAIEDHFDANYELESRLEAQRKRDLLQILRSVNRLANFIYVRQPEPRGNGDAVLRAEPVVTNEPFVMLWPDDLLMSPENSVRSMLRVYHEYGAPVVGVLPVRRNDVTKYGIIENRHIEGRVHEVLSIIEKPSLREAPSNLASVKGFVLTPDIFPILRKLKPGKSGEIWIVDAVNAYNRRHAVFACELSGMLYDLGSKLGWLKANVVMGLRRPDVRREFRTFLKQTL